VVFAQMSQGAPSGPCRGSSSCHDSFQNEPSTAVPDGSAPSSHISSIVEHEAYNRIVAARVGRRFPIVRDMLGEGSLNLTSVRLLASHLTDENHGKLLVGACGKSKREVEELIARLFPQPDVPCSVRKLPAAKLIETPPPPIPSGAPAISRPATEPIGIQAVPSPGVARALEPMSAVPAPTARHSLARPLAPGRYEIRFTASAGTCEKAGEPGWHRPLALRPGGRQTESLAEKTVVGARAWGTTVAAAPSEAFSNFIT